jgi:PIF1-like helicase
VRVESENDEIKTHVAGRYLSPPEAAWHIYKFRSHEEYPAVTRLAVHLPDEQPVYFDEDATPEEIHEIMERAGSTLMAFFRYNADHPDDRGHRYPDFPEHFVYDRRRWKPRQRGTAIGRMFQCNPSQGERFYLRVLLSVRRGPTSFEDLRTVEGVVHPTFRAACAAMGLLMDDREWATALDEAAVFASGHRLRSLFIFILHYCTVGDPLRLWEEFKDPLCDDLPHAIARFGSDRPDLAFPNAHHDYGLFLLARELQGHGRSLTDFQLPTPHAPWAHVDPRPPADSADIPDVDPEAAAALCAQLNADQRHAFERIVPAVVDASPDRQRHFFLQGAGGTGKTFLYRALYGHLRTAGKSILCVASSGIAATLLPRGRTAHSQFKIPLSLDDSSSCNVTRQSYLGRQLADVDLIIWDEVTMQNRFAFEAVDRLLRDMRGNDRDLFGGVPIVLGGDWAQTLPIVPRGNRAAVTAACLSRSLAIWPHLEILTLRQNMRLQGGGVNAQFADWLTGLSRDPDMAGPVTLPPYIPRVSSVAELCEAVFPCVQLANASRDPDFFARRAILAIRNDQLPPVNNMLMDHLPGPSQTSYSVDSASTEDGDPAEEATTEYLRTVDLPGIAPSVLELKVGAPVMLMRNLNTRVGLCNGTRLVITRLGRRVIEARILMGDYKGSLHCIPRMPLSSLAGDLPWIVTRHQFPLRPCFAMTVNKSQGQTLAIVGVNLEVSPFAHGQLNVALSRGTEARSLTVLLPQGVDTTVNVNYEEVILT